MFFTIIPKLSSESSGGGGGGGGGGAAGAETPKTYKIDTTYDTSKGSVKVGFEEVEKGGKCTITITPKAGYEVSSVKINGKEVGAVTKYTIENIKKDQDVVIKFKKAEEKETTSSTKEGTEEKDITKIFIVVGAKDWFKDPVSYVYFEGLFKGTSENEFSPNVPMSRAMLVTVLHRYAGSPESNTQIPFTDIDVREYYVVPLRWAYANKVISGTTETTFGTNENLTREQLVTILYRYAKLQNKDVSHDNAKSLDSYADANQIEEYAKEAFSWALNVGIITGRSETELAPKGNATRAEVATMIQRFATLVK